MYGRSTDFSGPSGAVAGATVDPNTGLFQWNSAGAPLGSYSAVISGSHDLGGLEDTGTLTFNLIPEPASITLFGLTVFAMFGFIRRR